MEILSDLQTTAQNLLAFASDTQAPMLVETIIMKSHKYFEETKLIFIDVL
jgi:hypothetical protein